MSSSLKRPVCTVAFSCISSSPLRTSLLSSPPSSSSSSSPLFLSLQRTLAIMTKIQKIEYDKEQARIARRVEEEKLSKKVQIPPSALGTLSTEELLKKNILHVPAPDAPFSEVYPGFIASLEKPVPWMRNENELKSGVKIDPLPWTEKSVRVGAVGRKMGMMHLWDHWGIQYPVTVIKIDSTVIHVHPHINEKTGLIGVQMGSGFVNPKKIKKPQMGHFKKAAVFPKHRLVEFQCTPDAVLPIGHVMSVRHFVPGQWLDVRGTSIGKGYQGAMKRWNFKGLPATHGVSVTHRSLGSTGSAQDPARVFKGKKMAGHLGNERVTQLNVRLFKIDTLRNLLFVVGTVPGHKNNYVVVRDAIKKKFTPSNPPPFPTYVIKAGDENVKEIVMQHSLLDPEDEDN